MDPLSHALIGLSTFSLINSPSFSNPACLGAVIGSIAPDLDIIARIKGDYVYLRHHRVESHSILGAIFIAFSITILMSLFFGLQSIKETLIWSLIGIFSHILMDFLNSYGVALLYPFTKKKYTLNLLMIYDPVVVILCLYIMFFKFDSAIEYIVLPGIFVGYLLMKALEKNRLINRLRIHFKDDYSLEAIDIMPSTLNPFKWDYIVSTSCQYIVGEIHSVKGKINHFRSLRKVWSPIVEKTLKEDLGIYFKSFSPIFHIDIDFKEKLTIKLTDLRYRIRNEFMHFAFFYYDENQQLITSEFQPFGLKNRIKI